MGSPVLTVAGLAIALVTGAVWWWWWDRSRRDHGVPRPAGRPIEEIARDVRRRGERLHALSPHASYVKVSALTEAYDHVLAECCDCLGQSHLLAVLAPGVELDRERRRVELVLHSFGLPVHHVA
jgi:hypothetical protein